MKTHLERGMSLAPGVEIGYVVRDARKWMVDIERDASGFDGEYCGKLLEKAWEEVTFVFPLAVVEKVDCFGRAMSFRS